MNKLIVVFALLTGLVFIGATGLKILSPSASWVDAFYMATITLTTVGFEEIIPLGATGRVFLIAYLMIGLSIFTYSLSVVGQIIVGVQLRPIYERRRMAKRIETVENHFIVCGLGRMGSAICDYLDERNKAFIVVDHSEALIAELCEDRNWMAMVGDATDDELLTRAGIHRARGIATVLPTDADNVYVTLTARMLCKKIQIIARASDAKAVTKLERAGANKVVSPFSSGAIRMARFMLNPSIEDFLEVTGAREDLTLADVQIPEGNKYVGKRLQDTDLRAMGLMIIGIRRSNGENLMPPPGSAVLEAGDFLFAFGSSKGISRFIELLSDESDD